ncbi:Cyanovirin-N [Coprinopsis sp. MPI-PUGE-AT-0042]|nr:Cyanovirin-N [Coprinopsis sp. MPI-PUGE-AT-0042]
MIRTSTLVSAAALLAVASASPSLLPRAGTIGSQCTNVRIVQGWLTGECLTGSGSTRITSGTYLNNKLTNDDGTIKWKKDGSYSTTCSSCRLIDGGSKLNCQCRPNFGQNKDTTITLDEHIGVYNGHLLSNLAGAPVVPSAPSKYEYPSDLSYRIGGKATCVADPPSIPGWCESTMPKCTDSDRTDFAETPIQQIAPLSTCFEPNFYFAEKTAFSEIKLASAGAWELTAYSDGACTKKLGVISPEQAGTCQTFGGEKVRGVITRPLFNGDPN